ncbi:hypothetical protein ACIPRI_18745 [Variovorax sp. LARHSF232]
MPNEQPGPSPQERLAISRRALVNQLQGEAAPGAAERPRASLLDGIAWAPVARGMARHWWQRHPLHAAGELARPVLERYAREQPLKLVAVAAATGALVVLAKPWRVLTATGVAATLFKTSDVAGVVTALMQRRPSARKKDPP